MIAINNIIIISHEHEAVHEKKYIINNILIDHQVLRSYGKTNVWNKRNHAMETDQQVKSRKRSGKVQHG